MVKLKPYKDDVYLWEYVPSLVASIIFVICYFIVTFVVTIRMFRSQSWFSTPFTIGGILEVIGFGARAVCHFRTDLLSPYAAQSVLILVAPALFAASIYMTLHRLMTVLRAEHHSIIRASWLTKIFVTGDVLSFLIQSCGASLITNEDFDRDIAKWIIFIGLIVQVAIYGLFVIATVLLHVRLRYEPTEVTLSSRDTRWLQTLKMIYTVSVFILARSAFRIIEYLMGPPDSYLFQHEWPLYVFDGELMLLTMAVYAWWYPGYLKAKTKQSHDVEMEHLQAPNGVHQNGVKPLMGQKKMSIY